MRGEIAVIRQLGPDRDVNDLESVFSEKAEKGRDIWDDPLLNPVETVRPEFFNLPSPVCRQAVAYCMSIMSRAVFCGARGKPPLKREA